MRRVPVAATLVVALAIAAMVALGVWQLRRQGEKAALLARLAANRERPAIALPAAPGPSALFRRVSATCAAPGGWSREAGRAADGSPGWRVIARCPRPGAGRFAVQIGVAASPAGGFAWSGGRVSGYLTQAPQHRALIAGLFAPVAAEPMIVADPPVAPLRPNPPADLADIPNNHLAYAVQWFAFAGVAAAVYAVALRRRRHPVAPPPARG